MLQAPQAPSSVPPASFADEADRTRLNKTALKAYRRLVDEWGLTGAEAAALLGVSVSTWERLKPEGRDRPLSQDQMTRLSALIGIYKSLKLMFSDDMAIRWPTLGNRGPLFFNRTPIAAMISGGIPHMLEVRRFLDAVRGGL
ncbi:uncharacterized protein (DUF2384 family) [Rhizobium sp. SG_E_25_P2]|uniref:antitoxin Xre-like helix-turn-helix domain-containing protein n=1 Tax=Rhizobium sp. SG_E_25_P2 TaxID=2879942 RepID=UPI0024747D91|nr:antitoxin Xre-like helix-turn-helix domain-containing protein [Rhizobium sp. SG_E_25_P2]MDH6269059.1 uncharacterized protein (DUF2384 family) [Rhizobium sp. SG_E_25_P2]